MHIEFKPLPMMALRSSPGEVLDEVSREGAACLIKRNGQQKACLVPRYVVVMTLYPERWLGGTIPIFFHWVLAAYLFAYGRFHARGRPQAG